MEPDTRGEADEPADEPAEVPADSPADVPADAEGAAVRAEGGVVVVVALPQAATNVTTRAAPRMVRTVAVERRIIDYPD